MSSALDMSLDEKIALSKRENNNRTKRYNRNDKRNNRNKNFNRKSRQGINEQWKHDKFDGDNRNNSSISSRIGRNIGNKNRSSISITNLYWGVSENDLKELFEEIGEVSKVRIKYDNAGRSEGEATVTFSSDSDARKAINQYNGVELDGQAMEIKLLESNNSNNRRDNGDSRNNGSIFKRLGQRKGFKNKDNITKKNNNSFKKRERKAPVTKEMLDEEMEKYMNNDIDMIDTTAPTTMENITEGRNIISYSDQDAPVNGALSV